MRTLVITLAIILHLAPRPFGISPVGALALYSGAFGRNRFFWAIPFLPLSAAVILFGFYDPVVMAFVFAGFAIASFAGRRFLSGDRTFASYGRAVGAGALIFYLVSNVGNWYAFYPRTINGLIDCYVNGLPFLCQSALADALFCYLLFGLHKLVDRRTRAPVVA